MSVSGSFSAFFSGQKRLSLLFCYTPIILLNRFVLALFDVFSLYPSLPSFCWLFFLWIRKWTKKRSCLVFFVWSWEHNLASSFNRQIRVDIPCPGSIVEDIFFIAKKMKKFSVKITCLLCSTIPPSALPVSIQIHNIWTALVPLLGKKGDIWHGQSK